MTRNRKHSWQEWLMFCLLLSVWTLAILRLDTAAGLLAVIIYALLWNMAGR